MSYLILKHNRNFSYIVLDTKDMVVEKVDIDDYNEAIGLGLNLIPFREQTSNIGVAVDGNSYAIYFADNLNPIYEGSFPTENNRNVLFDHIISVTNLGMVSNNIVIVVSCNVWCKYNIELPMVMTQVLSIPIKLQNGKGVLGKCRLSAFTSEPVLITDKSTALRQYKDCFADYPNTCVADNVTTSIKENKLKLFGVVYDELPIFDDVCKRLKFLQFQGN
jgi:hypothetical protein